MSLYVAEFRMKFGAKPRLWKPALGMFNPLRDRGQLLRQVKVHGMHGNVEYRVVRYERAKR